MSLHPHYSRARAGLLFGVIAALALWAVAAHAADAFTEEVEARTLRLVNEVRRQHGVPPLEREARLDATARDLATYMAASGTLDHDADGRTPGARVRQRGYDYCVIAENIAYEYSSRGFTAERLARSFIEGWLQSPTHRGNILDENVTQTGFAVNSSTRNEYYATQIFGRPQAPPNSKTKSKRGSRC